MRKSLRKFFLISILRVTAFLLVTTMAISVHAQQNGKKELKFDAMQWRFIGPIAGNRGSVVLGHPTKQNEFYHGASKN